MKTKTILSILIYCLLFSVLFISVGYTQTRKGTLLLGGNGGMSFNSDLNENNFNAYVSPRIGFFIIDKFALGSGLPFSFTTSQDYERWSIGIGPFVRYYFVGGKLSPFLQAEGSWSRFRYRYREANGGQGTNTGNTRSVGLGVGLAYFITPIIGLESILSYDATRTRTRTGQSSSGRGGLNLNIGFQIYFSRSQK